MEQEVIKNEECCPTDSLQTLLVLHVIRSFECYELLQVRTPHPQLVFLAWPEQLLADSPVAEE